MKSSDLKRITADREIDFMLSSEEGRKNLCSLIEQRCAESSLIALLEEVAHLPGDVIECGVFRGNSLWNIGHTLKSLAPGKTVYALDSFEGFPPEQITNEDTTLFRPAFKLRNKFKFAKDVPERIESFLFAFGIKGEIRRGYFEATLPEFSMHDFCFVHIDSDTYSSHIECLEALYNRVVRGGIIVFDDYNEPKWPGAKKAVDEFLSNRPERPQLDSSRSTPACYIRKE
jgi:hypothetical protein